MRGIITVGLLLIGCRSFAQAQRIADHNSISWWSNTTVIKLSNKWSTHLEYQWRRANTVADWQQGLLRTGIMYQLTDRVQLRAGYAYIETFPYGDYPLQAAGKMFPEHRLYEMVTLSDKINHLTIIHRFMLEQRWVGRYSNPSLDKADTHTYVNRIRYMLRLQRALGKKEIIDKTIYAAAYDELFTGFGNNIGENVFDQNRLGLMIGYRFSPAVRIEGGYLNQIVQLGREINGSNVFQHNSGFIFNTYFNFGK